MRDNQLDDLTLYTFTNRRTEPEPGSVSQISEGSKQLELFDYKKLYYIFLFTVWHSLIATHTVQLCGLDVTRLRPMIPSFVEGPKNVCAQGPDPRLL